MINTRTRMQSIRRTVVRYAAVAGAVIALFGPPRTAHAQPLTPSQHNWNTGQPAGGYLTMPNSN
jgi:hypothetical protein